MPDFAALVHPEIEIRTAQTTYLGPEAATEWAQKRYEHLERHYAIDRLEEKGDHVVARVRTQYVWRDSGLVGDEEPAVIDLAIQGRQARALGVPRGLALRPASRRSFSRFRRARRTTG